MDVAIPIVFPDYRIAVEIKPLEVDLLPWFEFDDFRTPSYKDRWSNLGHAGILFVNGASGLTKYYEYGRYDKAGLGRVQKRSISKRRPYDILNYSCIHFVKDVVASAGIDTPWMIDPRPNSYIGKFRDDHPDLDYSPRSRELKVEGRT